MRKILASVAAATLLAPLASNADQTLITAHEEPTVVVEPEECCAADFSGFGFILGVGGNFLKNEYKVGDVKVFGKNANRFMGTIGISGGKQFHNNLFVGGEFLFDFTKNTKSDVKSDFNAIVANIARDAHIRTNGSMYSLGLRLGYVFPKYGTMVYFKVAGSHVTSKLYGEAFNLDDGRYEYDEGKVSKIAPSVALGLEKAFCKKFTARLEAEYRFQAKKSFDGSNLKQKGMFNIRALVSYNVRF